MASLLICADIFGVTPQLKKWADNLNVNGETRFIDAYDTRFDFTDETSAYAKFMESGGIDAFVEKVSLCIAQHHPAIVIGFSAGAASAYKALSLLKNQQYTQRLIGFYPGQIRHFTHLSPTINSTLYFANSEPHFSVEQIIHVLRGYENVQCHQTKYKHGFMNPKSSGYSPQGHVEFTNLVIKALQPLLV